MTAFEQAEHPNWDHVCDLCFGHFPPEGIAEHMREAHGIEQSEVLGYVKQEDGILTAEDPTGKLVVDMHQWVVWARSGFSPEVPNGIIENTRKHGGDDEMP